MSPLSRTTGRQDMSPLSPSGTLRCWYLLVGMLSIKPIKVWNSDVVCCLTISPLDSLPLGFLGCVQVERYRIPPFLCSLAVKMVYLSVFPHFAQKNVQ